MKKNHTKIIGANTIPTLSVPNRCAENKITKIATVIPTTASEEIKIQS